eukprot:scaffold7.g3716.t1
MGSGKRSKRTKERRSKKSGDASSTLLLQAALGSKKGVKRALKDGASPNARSGPQGETALHEACRHGHLDVIATLLKRGADAAARDTRGNTPAHVAASAGQLPALAALLQAKRPPSTELRNDAGISIGEAAAGAMERDELRRFEAEQRRSRQTHGSSEEEEKDEEHWGSEERGERGRAPWGRPAKRRRRSASPAIPGRRGGGRAFAGEGAGEEDWRQRLAEENSDGEGGAWGPWAEEEEWHGDEYETAEQYAQRIWQEMQDRLFLAREREQAAFHAARAAQKAARGAARQAAAAESARVLEEQRSRDAAWRAALLAGNAGAARARYEAAWQFFAHGRAAGGAPAPSGAAAIGPEEAPKEIRYGDVPWILEDEEASADRLREVVMFGAMAPEEQRRRLRTELMRWHSDKFVARFGRLLAPADRARILARVTATSQALTALNASLKP